MRATHSRTSILPFLAATVFAAAIPNAAAQEQVGAWSISSYSPNGVFSHCAMTTRSSHGSRILAFYVGRTQFRLAVYDPRWNFETGARFEGHYQLDGGARVPITARAGQVKLLSIVLPADKLLYAQFRTASWLRIAFDSNPEMSAVYSIAASAAAFDRLYACATAGVNAAAPPQARGPSDEQQGQDRDEATARPRYTPPANPARPPPAARPPATPPVTQPANPPVTPPATGAAEKPARAGKAEEGAVESTGTGFFVSAAGHILTAEHVIRGCKSVRAQAIGDVPLAAVVVARSASDDLALLKTAPRREAVAPIRSGSLRLGEQIVVFGFPLTGALASSGNLTTGNIAALAGVRDDHRMMQISAPVQPGNSGGPVFDLRGRVVGVVLSGLGTRFARATGTLPQNINFGVKASVVSSFLEAHGVTADNNGAATDMAVADVADRARLVTVRVECVQ